MKKKIITIMIISSVMIIMTVSTNAQKQSSTKNNAFWEDYIFYHIIGKNEVEALAIDKDYAEANGYYDSNLFLKGKDYHPKKKIAFSFSASVKHNGKIYKLTHLPDYKSSNYFEKHDLRIIPNKGQNFICPSATLYSQYSNGNGLPLNYLNSITTIILPDTLEFIGSGSLAYCDKLEEVVFAKKYDYLTFGNYVFGSTHIKSIQIPEGTYKLGDCALGEIPSVSLPKSLKKIGANVINNNTKKVTIAPGNSKFKMRDGILYSSDESVLYGASAKVPKNVVIPKKVKEIKTCAFAFSNIKTVTFKSKYFSSISPGAFANCRKLTKISGLKEINYIEYAAFAGCEKLYDIGKPTILSYVGEAAFWDTKKPEIKLFSQAKVKKYAFEKPELGPEE